MRRVVFFRHFLGLTGGHLKVWHYFAHLASSDRFRPEIYFTPDSLMDESNPWVASGIAPLHSWSIEPGDIVFLAGLDWQQVPDRAQLERPRASIVNLIQGLGHADPGDARFSFLQRPATRICVSEQVADAIRKTRQVNGSVFTVRAAIDLSELPKRADKAPRTIALLIAGAKNPRFAAELGRVLDARGIEYQMLTETLPRSQYLEMLAKSSTVVLLPLEIEGFFLPALEAMALETLVICPDCVGNRGHCIDGVNSLRPAYRLEEVAAAVVRAGSLLASEWTAMLTAATATLGLHRLDQERAQVLRIFEELG